MNKINRSRPLPKISVVIPVLNMEKFLELTLKTIINQRYPSLEVIIEDGKSSDGTVDIIKRYARKFPNIITWESRKDKGQYAALRLGFDKARGEILTFINGDDYYEKGAFLSVGKYFQRHTNCLWLVGRGKVVDKKGKEYARFVTWYKNLLLWINKYFCLLLVNYIMQPSVFFTKEAYRRYGPIKGDKVHLREFDFWYKLGKVSMPGVLNEYLSCYSLFPGTGSTIYYEPIILKDDYETTKNYTTNPIILFLRLFHNYGRILIYKIFYSRK